MELGTLKQYYLGYLANKFPYYISKYILSITYVSVQLNDTRFCRLVIPIVIGLSSSGIEEDKVVNPVCIALAGRLARLDQLASLCLCLAFLPASQVLNPNS